MFWSAAASRKLATPHSRAHTFFSRSRRDSGSELSISGVIIPTEPIS